MFKFICHHCSNVLEHEEDLIGEYVQCDECDGVFVVDQVALDEAALPQLSASLEEAPLSAVEDVSAPSEEGVLPEVEDVSNSTFPDSTPSTPDVKTTADGQPLAAGNKPIAKRIKIVGGILLGLCAVIAFSMTGRQSNEAAPLEVTRSQQTVAPVAAAKSTASAKPAKSAKSTAVAKPAASAKPAKSAASTKSTTPAKSAVVAKAAKSAKAPKALPQKSLDGKGQEFVLQGLISGRMHETKKRMIYELSYGLEGKRMRTSGSGGKNAPGIDYKKFVGKYVRLTGRGQRTDKGIALNKITQIEPLSRADLDAYLNALEAAKTRPFDASPNALPFAGTWGPRLSLPTAKQPDVVDDFKVSDFAKQFSKLKSASYIVVNVTQPSGPCYFSGPNPQLAKISSKLKASITTRDLLGEVLDAIAKDGKKALVYYACEGFHKGDDTRPQKEKDMRSAWDKYVESVPMTNNEALGELVVGYYAKRYGNKIHGWWFDGAGVLDKDDRLLWRKLVREGNPEAMVAFNRMAGPPFRSTPECDVFGGHPTPRSREHFWSLVNLPMIEGVESGAWMDPEGKPVDEPGMGALGHVFMGMQDRWNSGKCEFPPEQAIEWTQRVLSAGGMYTWHGPRTQSTWAKDQFELLLKIDAGVTKMRKNN